MSNNLIVHRENIITKIRNFFLNLFKKDDLKEENPKKENKEDFKNEIIIKQNEEDE